MLGSAQQDFSHGRKTIQKACFADDELAHTSANIKKCQYWIGNRQEQVVRFDQVIPIGHNFPRFCVTAERRQIPEGP